MTPHNDIKTIEDIKLLVDTFYGKVREDALLKDIFDNVIRNKWPEHLEKMYRFWQTILLEEHTYFGSPFPPHVKLPVNKEHFNQWLKLFFETVDENFAGETSAFAKKQGERMAEIFHTKIMYFRDNASTLLL